MLDYIIIGLLATSLILGLISLVIGIINQVKLKKFMQGKNGKSLEGVLEKLISDLEDQQSLIELQSKSIENIFAEIDHLTQEPTCLRFNPFNDSGGNQCFAIAILSKTGNGVVLSSLYAHGKTSVFAKPINNFGSKYDLTAEEKQVIGQIMKSKNYVK